MRAKPEIKGTLPLYFSNVYSFEKPATLGKFAAKQSSVI
jgi:hypothetical protein